MAKRKKNKGREQPRISRDAMQTLLHGPRAASVKSQVSPDQWQRLVRAAHKRGVTVDSFLQGGPRSLMQRTPSSIRHEAQRTISTAYRPVFQTLSDQERKVKAIDAKRASDNQYYLDWLSAQTAKLNAGAQAGESAIQNRQDAIQNEIAQAYGALPGQLQAQSAARAGNVSDPTENTQVGAQVAGGMSRDLGLINAERTATTDQIANTQAARQQLTGDNAAFIASLDAKRQADTNDQLTGISDKRLQAAQQKAADATQEVARIKSQQIDVANANRDYQAVLEKLGISKAQTKLDKAKLGETVRHNKAAERIRNKQLGIDIINANTQAKNADINQQNADTAKQRADEQARHNAENEKLSWWKARHPPKRKPTDKEVMRGTNQTSFDTAYAGIGGLQVPTGKTDDKGKAITRGIKTDDLRKNPKPFITAIMRIYGVNYKVAKAAALRYITTGDSNVDPGSYKDAIRGMRQSAGALPGG